MVHLDPSQQGLPRFYQTLEFWQNQGIKNQFTDQSWLENLTSSEGLRERLNRSKLHLQVILNHTILAENAKIIELGSGFSPFLYHCRQQGLKNLYALEPSDEICRFLDGQGITTYPTLLETFITQKDLPQFDVVVLSHTMEHLINPDVILRGLRTLLSDQGLLLIVVPYKDFFRPNPSGLHLHFFNENSMAHLLTKCGYQTLFLQADRLNAIETALIKTLDLIHKHKYSRVTWKSLFPHQRREHLHRFFWRPLRRLLRLKVSVIQEPRNLFALARR
ncbi:MAG: class I SAM-dependent methyltransferase [bacterium]|nr:class I SAM-dependent methyltransferase [bacterium]